MTGRSLGDDLQSGDYSTIAKGLRGTWPTIDKAMKAYPALLANYTEQGARVGAMRRKQCVRHANIALDAGQFARKSAAHRGMLAVGSHKTLQAVPQPASLPPQRMMPINGSIPGSFAPMLPGGPMPSAPQTPTQFAQERPAVIHTRLPRRGPPPMPRHAAKRLRWRNRRRKRRCRAVPCLRGGRALPIKSRGRAARSDVTARSAARRRHGSPMR